MFFLYVKPDPLILVSGYGESFLIFLTVFSFFNGMFVYAMMYQIVFLKKTYDSYRGRTEMTKQISLFPSKNGIRPLLKKHNGRYFLPLI